MYYVSSGLPGLVTRMESLQATSHRAFVLPTPASTSKAASPTLASTSKMESAVSKSVKISDIFAVKIKWPSL
jgi:hypothetical protein